MHNMTMRQYYKAAVASRVLSYVADDFRKRARKDPDVTTDEFRQVFAEECGLMADAMLAEDAARASGEGGKS